MEWIPAPAEDLEEYVTRTFRKVLIDLPAFAVPCAGFSAPFTALASGKEIIFPQVGVDFRTVTSAGFTGAAPTPLVLTPEGLVAKLVYPTDQTGTITIPAYSSWSTYCVGVVSDLTFDLFTWFGDPAAKDKQQRTIPLLIPTIDGWDMKRLTGRGEQATIMGTVVMYGTANTSALRTLKTEAGKAYNAIRNNAVLFTAAGLTHLQIDPPTYSFVAPSEGKGLMYEAQMKFSTLVLLH